MNYNAYPSKSPLWIPIILLGLATLVGLAMWAYGGYLWLPMTGGMMAIGMLGMVLAVAGASWLVYQAAVAPANGADALSIVEARYAKGEISREDYLRLRQDLLGPRGG